MGPMLVLAGPGSGKTTMIAHRVLRLCRENRVPEEQILVLTYTRAAAQEMRSRSLRLLGTENTAISFGTFHSIFWRMLREQGRLCGYTLLEEPERLRLGMEILRETGGIEAEIQAQAEEYLKLYEKGHPEKDAGYREWSEAYRREKLRRKYLDYEDILTEAVRMLRDERIRFCYQRKFRYILVDEFQDVNPAQYYALRLLAGNDANVFAVGDDDQAIYGFRGAVPDIMRRFPEDFPGCTLISLPLNYRSTRRIVELSGRLIAHNKNRYEKKIRAASGEKGKRVSRRIYEAPEEECREIAELARKEKGRLAILFRTRYQAAGLIKVLEDYNLPFQMEGYAWNPYDHWIGQDIDDYIRAAHGECEAIKRILNKSYPEIPEGVFSWLPEGECAQVLLSYSMDMEVRMGLEELFYQLGKLRVETPGRGMHRIAAEMGYLKYLRKKAERSGIPPRELMRRFDFWQREAEPCRTWQEWRETRREKKSSWESPTPAVQIMTLHAAKGLEFPTVWIPEIESGSLPHERAADLEEERRLLYVGCTRAREELILSCCKARGGRNTQESVFWKELI